MKSLFVLLGIASLFATGNALRCYACVQCGDPFDKEGVTVTDSIYTIACAKDILISSTATAISRYAIDAYSLPTAISKKDAKADVVSGEIYVCTSDYCNGATSAYASLSMLFALAAILRFANWN